MKELFKNSKLIVATTLHDTDTLVPIGARLCQATGMTLKLVHVIEPVAPLEWPLYAGDQLAAMEFASRIVEANLADARQQLALICSRLEPNLKASWMVSTGLPAEGILQAAKDASMILISLGPRHYQILPRYLSTALSLTAEAPVPVMAIPQECAREASFTAPKILVADDFRPETTRALAFGFALAKACAGSLIHLHVLAVSRYQSLAKILGKTTDSPDLLGKAHRMARQKLEERAFPFKNGEVAYEAQVLCAENVDDGLLTFTETHRIDAAVFGRHQGLHSRPLHFGRVPFHAMFALKCPIVVTPPASEKQEQPST